VTALNNSQNLAVFLTMTCLTGDFNTPGYDCLAEALLRNSSGGCVAYWGSSGLTYANPQTPLNQEMMNLLFNGQSITLGEAARQAKSATWDTEARKTWILFGDPAMRLH
jgi:hypothetical protein